VRWPGVNSSATFELRSVVASAGCLQFALGGGRPHHNPKGHLTPLPARRISQLFFFALWTAFSKVAYIFCAQSLGMAASEFAAS